MDSKCSVFEVVGENIPRIEGKSVGRPLPGRLDDHLVQVRAFNERLANLVDLFIGSRSIVMPEHESLDVAIQREIIGL